MKKFFKRKQTMALLLLSFFAGMTYNALDPVYGNLDWASLLGTGFGAALFYGLPVALSLHWLQGVKARTNRVRMIETKNGQRRVQCQCEESTDQPE